MYAESALADFEWILAFYLSTDPVMAERILSHIREESFVRLRRMVTGVPGPVRNDSPRLVPTPPADSRSASSALRETHRSPTDTHCHTPSIFSEPSPPMTLGGPSTPEETVMFEFRPLADGNGTMASFHGGSYHGVP